jgi:hypothetical protein
MVCRPYVCPSGVRYRLFLFVSGFKSFGWRCDWAGGRGGSWDQFVRLFGVRFLQHKYFYVFVIGNSKNALNTLWAPQKFLHHFYVFHNFRARNLFFIPLLHISNLKQQQQILEFDLKHVTFAPFLISHPRKRNRKKLVTRLAAVVLKFVCMFLTHIVHKLDCDTNYSWVPKRKEKSNFRR